MPPEIQEDKTFSRISANDPVFSSRQFESCKFVNCDLANANLSKILFIDCLFEDCNLSLANVISSGFGPDWGETLEAKEQWKHVY